MVPTFIELIGLSNKAVFVDRTNVLYLEETDVNGTVATNLHFTNGRWVTIALAAKEIAAVVENSNPVKPETLAEKKIRWMDEMKIRREVQLEIDAAIKESLLESSEWNKVNHMVETRPDGSKAIHVILEPKETTRVEP